LEVITHVLIESPRIYLLFSAFIGITFLLFVVALVYDLTVSISRRVPFDQERRRFIKVAFDITMLIAAISYLLRGLGQGLARPALNTVAVTIPDFPFNQFSIVQLTDIHVGRTIKRGFVEQLVARTNDLMPDMVVITGDLADLPIRYIRDDLEPLRKLRAPTYFVLGNHEYFHGPQSILKHIVSLGIRPLLNDSVLIGDTDKGFDLIGLNDSTGQRTGIYPDNVEAAYRKTQPDRPCIVLAHQPRAIDTVAGKRCDLMLCGHTHGGQIFPFGFLVMMAQPYLAGLHWHTPDQQIFVSRGAGYWGPPLRVLAPSEISRIVIRPAVVNA
ncbi:MAG TPA: metallophosphoesterase, partial [Chromatiales bacterium]|nr:metallophosphoesterase [Chromatiales bacterium]